MKKVLRIVFLLAVLLAAKPASAISFNLDSIATWGKFPRFVVNTYRWGDHFFNGYDTTYVVSTGYKFNAKAVVNSWSDGYHFQLPDNNEILMLSPPSTSLGLTLTYMAVSASYDINVSKLFGGRAESRNRWQFGFNCMLFSAEFFYIHNNSTTTIRRFGPKGHREHLNLPFNGIDNTQLGAQAVYFFNHKRYSEAASFSFSRIQKKSQGAFYLGFSYTHQKLSFNFRGLPPQLINQLPQSWKNATFGANTHDFAIRVGYGYNWVFHPKWVLGVSESPVIGISRGIINSSSERITPSLYNRLKASVVWNNGRWFASISGKFDVTIVNDQKTTYAGGDLTGEAVVGYRFNIW